MTISVVVLSGRRMVPTPSRVAKLVPVPPTVVSRIAHGRMLLLVVPIPPAPTRVAVCTMISATPFAAALPRFEPRSKSVPPTPRVKLPMFNIDWKLPLAVSVMTVCPTFRVSAPTVSATLAVVLGVRFSAAPASVTGRSPRRLKTFVPLLSRANVAPGWTVTAPVPPTKAVPLMPNVPAFTVRAAT